MTLQFQQQHDYITQKYGSGTDAPALVTFRPGHTKSLGRTANQMKNPIWEITNPHTGEIMAVIMYCEPNEYCELCPMSYQKILEYEMNHNNPRKCVVAHSFNKTIFYSYIIKNENRIYHNHVSHIHYLFHGSAHPFQYWKKW